MPATVEVLGVDSRDAHEARLDAAGKLIANASRWSVVASLIPVPYADLGAIGAIQTSLITNLASLYDQKLTKQAVGGLVSVLLGMLVPAAASRVALGVGMKWIPGAGTAVGTITLAAFGSAATYAIGKVFVRHFERGGTFKSFSAAEAQADLKNEFAAASSKT